MTHRLIMNSSRGRRIYDFVVEREGQRGWAWLRLTRIEDDPPLPDRPAIQTYDPEIHNQESIYALHHMSHLWRARGCRRWLQTGRSRYSLVGAFGTPGYTNLEYIP